MFSFVVLQAFGLIADALVVAAQTMADPTLLLLIFLVVLFGMFMGAVPGLGGIITLTLLIPLTFGMEPIVAFMLLAAALGATNFGGSITAILINTPGSAVNAATILDGYPMARQGRAREALGAAATASAVGAMFGLVVLFLSIPVMMEILLMFSQIEIFWLGIWGVTILAMIVRHSVLSGLISAALGFVIAFHGLNADTASARWTYGSVQMLDGFGLIPVLVGLFAIAEMINLVAAGRSIADKDIVEVEGNQWTGIKDVFIHRGIFLRSAIIGVLIGMVPGVGGTTANYLAYFQAVQTSEHPERYGTGDVRGVIASEASNDAKDGGGFLPTLAFGIPGSASMAVMIGAFAFHGIIPGPRFFGENLDIVMMIILALLVSNILTSIIGVAMATQFAKVTRIDIHVLAPIVLLFALFAAYAIRNNMFDVYIATLFGVFGFLMIKVKMSRVPMVIALVLADIIERNFFRSLQIGGGDYAVFFRSYLSILLVVLILLSLFLPYIRSIVSRRGVLTDD